LHCPRPYLSVSFSDAPLTLHSFPTRRSSDLIPGQTAQSFATDGIQQTLLDQVGGHLLQRLFRQHQGAELTHVTRHHHPPLVIPEDRKSTRLNSSHVKNSYAVFCLKKKKK